VVKLHFVNVIVEVSDGHVSFGYEDANPHISHALPKWNITGNMLKFSAASLR
jgi:hypothetical protein